MVNLTEICFKYMPFYLRYPDRRGVFFRRQAVFRLTGSFYGRTRNVWRVAAHRWVKKMVYLKEYRRTYEKNLNDLYAQRLTSAAEEHNFKYEYLLAMLFKSNVYLDKKMLSMLAIYEPRTFKSLVDFAKTVYHEHGNTEKAKYSVPPDGVITRGMIND